MLYSENNPKILKARYNLAEAGFFAMYGGAKGHGFWIYPTSPDLARALTDKFDAAGYWAASEDLRLSKALFNYHPSSSDNINHLFWMYDEIGDLITRGYTTKSGYQIRFNQTWGTWQVSHPDIGACIAEFKSWGDAFEYCEKG